MKNDRDERITLVMPRRSNQPDLMSSELEFAPLDKKSDYRFHMTMQPLKIVYDSVRKCFLKKQIHIIIVTFSQQSTKLFRYLTRTMIISLQHKYRIFTILIET